LTTQPSGLLVPVDAVRRAAGFRSTQPRGVDPIEDTVVARGEDATAPLRVRPRSLFMDTHSLYGRAGPRSFVIVQDVREPRPAIRPPLAARPEGRSGDPPQECDRTIAQILEAGDSNFRKQGPGAPDGRVSHGVCGNTRRDRRVPPHRARSFGHRPCSSGKGRPPDGRCRRSLPGRISNPSGRCRERSHRSR
jgi:hypothetical protein